MVSHHLDTGFSDSKPSVNSLEADGAGGRGWRLRPVDDPEVDFVRSRVTMAEALGAHTQEKAPRQNCRGTASL